MRHPEGQQPAIDPGVNARTPRMPPQAASVNRPTGDGARQSLSHEKSLWQRRLAEKEGLASEAQRAGGMKTTSKYMAALARKTVLHG